ncbi:MAG: hypothetical protein DRP50_00410 [Thermotoga sp.]|nr:MAG: hypothetical protein DRP50_00410 [Thermotoga sp.]
MKQGKSISIGICHFLILQSVNIANSGLDVSIIMPQKKIYQKEKIGIFFAHVIQLKGVINL